MTFTLIVALFSPHAVGEGGTLKPSDEFPQESAFDLADLKGAVAAAGLEFTDEELAQLMPLATDRVAHYEKMRSRSVENTVAPASIFRPLEASPTVDDRTLAATDPLLLHQARRLRPIDQVQIIQETPRERGDSKHPLL